MRLTQIKLSGFKSFVDPTVIPTPSDLVGVVGPNGCGKSNIIDAVRWVLGESRASELRGASMQDVIFNGSGDRKAAARASVELVFDNSLGRAAGQWSTYAEIAVRRVLTRDGASSYFVNNQQVRRRDIYDIFLGTGLGAKGYAIIGQGMINRLIEARPEDLRVYLEEAAGVSRYKERRRETENRLQDTRENLTRLEDIIRELDNQLEKLQNQAVVAKQYIDLQADGELKQNALCLLREQAAIIEQKKLADEYASQQIKLEQLLADLRASQADLEQSRQIHFELNELVHKAQGDLFAAGSTVSRYEAEIKHISESRSRLQARHAQLQVQIQQWQDQQKHALAAIDELEIKLVQAQDAATDLSVLALNAQEGLPELDAELKDIFEQRESLRRQLARDAQKLALSEHTQANNIKQIQLLTAKHARLLDEHQGINLPDENVIEGLSIEYEIAQAKTLEAQDNLLNFEALLAKCHANQNNYVLKKQLEQEQLSKLSAKLQALEALQTNLRAKDSLQHWLSKQGLNDGLRLWEEIQVPAVWATAIESVLRERMQAIQIPDINELDLNLSEQPPVKLAFYSLGLEPEPGLELNQDQDTANLNLTTGSANNGAHTNSADSTTLGNSQPLVSLLSLIKTKNPKLLELLEFWLQDVYVAEDLQEALNHKNTATIVVPEGHIVDKFSIRYYAADDEYAGMLAREQEIENLRLAIKAAELLVENSNQACLRADDDVLAAQTNLQRQRQQLDTYLRQEHAVQLDLNNLRQQLNSANTQQSRLKQDLNELELSKANLQEQNIEAEMDFARFSDSVAALEEQILALDGQIESLSNKINTARQHSHEQEKRLQDANFEVRTLSNRIVELQRNLQLANEQADNSLSELENLQGDLFELDESSIKQSLEQALTEKIAAEQTLRVARIDQEKAESELRIKDQKRLQIEQKIEPQRAKITDLQLKEQASRLTIEQYADQLNENQVDRQVLQTHIDQQKWQDASWLQSEVQSINRKMAALGAVNLAALAELGKAQERKQFLTVQQEDLQIAIDTLESAIRKIDSETRVLLRQTFDKVNEQFGDLFPKLFGGGKASLTMIGDEVLDSGVQVMAQPPGKRNSTINLLSGGEKALTAIALVFAFFKLNPAPFCLLDEVDAPLDDANTERYANLVRSMSNQTQFLFISHNKIAMQMAKQLVGVTMQEQGVSRIVAVDMDAALQLALPAA